MGVNRSSGQRIGSGLNQVCSASASTRVSRRELNAALPDALLDMTRGGVNSPVAPVDLSQAIIGPGMAIFSQYSAVLEADGKPMSVRTALQLINRFFAEDDFDHDTQFCLAWFDSQGWATAKFGDADVLARAKGTSVGGLVESGGVASSAGSLRLLRWAELAKDWAPEQDAKSKGGTPVWESLHQLIRALNQDGESAAGGLLARMPERAEPMRAPGLPPLHPVRAQKLGRRRTGLQRAGDRYIGFSFNRRTSLILDASLLLIEPVAAAGYAELQRVAEEAARPKPADFAGYAAGDDARAPGAQDPVKPTDASSGDAPTRQAIKK